MKFYLFHLLLLGFLLCPVHMGWAGPMQTGAANPSTEESLRQMEIALPSEGEEIVLLETEKFSPRSLVGVESLAIAPLTMSSAVQSTSVPSQPIHTLLYRKFRLPEFAYKVGSKDLSDEGMRLLSLIADGLRQEGDSVIVRIDGHTDNIGSDRYNDQLSLECAESAANHFMVRDGIPPSRLYVKGFGEKVPLASNLTPEGRSQNRRVELLLLTPRKVSE